MYEETHSRLTSPVSLCNSTLQMDLRPSTIASWSGFSDRGEASFTTFLDTSASSPPSLSTRKRKDGKVKLYLDSFQDTRVHVKNGGHTELPMPWSFYLYYTSLDFLLNYFRTNLSLVLIMIMIMIEQYSDIPKYQHLLSEEHGVEQQE